MTIDVGRRSPPSSGISKSCATRSLRGVDGSVGVAVAVHNGADLLPRCLAPFVGSDAVVVVYDDGSTDGSAEVARAVLPGVVVLHGSGSAWWAGGTKAAADECLRRSCGYVLLLNPDVHISQNGVAELVAHVDRNPNSIAAALVVDMNDEGRIAWAGSRFVRHNAWLPLWGGRYVARGGDPISVVGARPYEVDEVHGRGVLVPRGVWQALGGLDADCFPHYGADNDFSLRARSAGVRLFVVPSVRASVDRTRSGMAAQVRPGSWARVAAAWQYLTATKNGDALRVNWRFARRHLPWYGVVPSWLFWLAAGLRQRLLPPAR